MRTKTDLSGNVYWYNSNNQLHREDGPAIEHADGTKEWWVDGKRHREDGPAVEHADGYKSWHLNGKRHRLDGPAVEHANGTKYWYLNGKEYSEEKFLQIMQTGFSESYNSIVESTNINPKDIIKIGDDYYRLRKAKRIKL